MESSISILVVMVEKKLGFDLCEDLWLESFENGKNKICLFGFGGQDQDGVVFIIHNLQVDPRMVQKEFKIFKLIAFDSQMAEWSMLGDPFVDIIIALDELFDYLRIYAVLYGHVKTRLSFTILFFWVWFFSQQQIHKL